MAPSAWQERVAVFIVVLSVYVCHPVLSCLTVNVQLDMPLGTFLPPFVGQYPPMPDFIAGVSTINAQTALHQLPVDGVGQLFQHIVYWQSQCFLLNLLPIYRIVGGETQVNSVQDMTVLADRLCRNSAEYPPQAITAIDSTTWNSEMFRALNYVCNSFNIPTIGLYYQDGIFSDKYLYPLSSRVTTPSDEEAITMLQILQRYGWKRLAVIEGLTYSQADTIAALKQLAEQTNIQLFVQTMTAFADCTNVVNQIVNGAWKIVYIIGLDIDIQQCVYEMMIHRQLGSQNYIPILSSLSVSTLTTGGDLSTLSTMLNGNATLLKGVFGLYADIQISPLGSQCLAARMALSPPISMYDASVTTHFTAWDAIIHAHQGITGMLAQRLNESIQLLNQTLSNPLFSMSAAPGSTQSLVENFTAAFLSVFSLDGKFAHTTLNVSAIPNANQSFNVIVPFDSIRYNSSNIWYYFTNQSRTSMQSTLTTDMIVFDNNGEEIRIVTVSNFDGQNSNLVAKFNLLYDSYTNEPNVNTTWPNSTILNEYAVGWPSDRTPPTKFITQCLTCSRTDVRFTASSSASSPLTSSSLSSSAASAPIYFKNVHNLQSVYELVVSVANPSVSQFQFSCDGTAPLSYSLLPLLPGISSIPAPSSASADLNETATAIQLTSSSNGNLLQVDSASLIAVLDSLYTANPEAFSSADSMPFITPAGLLDISNRLANSTAAAATATDAAAIVGVINGANHEFRLSFLLSCDNSANSVSAIFSILTTPPADIYTPSAAAQTALSSMNGLGLFTVCVFAALVYAHREHKVIFSSSPPFLFTILCGFACLFVSSLLSILPATTAICQSKLILFHFGFILALGSIFVKTYRLHRIFNSDNLFNISISNSKLLGGVSLLLVVDVIVLLCWIEISGVRTFSANQPYCYTAGTANTIFPAVFAATKGTVIFCGIYLTFKVRALPANFNESRDISLVIYNTAVLAVLYIVVFFATALEPAQLSIFTAVIVFVGAFLNLIVFFAPKFRAMKGDILDFSHRGLTSTLSTIRRKANLRQQNPLGSFSRVDGRMPSPSIPVAMLPGQVRNSSISEQKTSSTPAALEESKSMKLKEILQDLKKDFLSKISIIKNRRLELIRLDKRSAEMTNGLAQLVESLRSVVLTIQLVTRKLSRSQSKTPATQRGRGESETVGEALEVQRMAAELNALVEVPIEAVDVDATNPLQYEIAESFQANFPAASRLVTQMKQDNNHSNRARRPSTQAVAAQDSVSPKSVSAL